MRSLGVVALVCGCATGELAVEPAVERAMFGPLELAVPSGWRSRDLSLPDTAIAMWTPDDNPNRESIVVIRSRPMPELSATGPEPVRRLLDEALGGLPRAAFGTPFQTRSRAGLVGVSVDGTFVPPGRDQPHRRIHAVLFEGASLVHVMFTTGAAEASAEPFEIVFASLRRKEV